jgi:hypothetical protein
VAAIALRAMARLVGDPNRTVRSLGVDLVARITPGTLELWPRIDRAGSSMSAVELVRITTGLKHVRSFSRMRRSTSSPSMFGSWRSNITSRGRSLAWLNR